MIIDCISDLHGEFPHLEGGDLLIVAGDCTSNDSVQAWNDYFLWLENQDYKKKIMIAGNHDNFCKQWATSDDFIYKEFPDDIKKCNYDYLCDSGTEFVYYPPLIPEDENPYHERNILKIWGSPWTKKFTRMNRHCMAFTVDTDEELAKKWDLIPNDIDILITHCPPYGIFDEIQAIKFSGRGQLENVGSISLRNAILSKDRFPNLKLHIFGHIHKWGGQSLDVKGLTLINASYVNEDYDPVNKPVRIVL